MKNVLLTILLGLFCYKASSQNPQQVIAYADRLYDRGEYLGAIKFYRSAMEIDSANSYLRHQMGSTYNHLNQLEKAAYYMEKASKLDWEGKFKLLDFELAEVYFKLGNHRYAERYYRRALRPYRSDKESEWFQRINLRMQSLDYAKAQKVEYEKSKIKSLEMINTGNSEFSPMMINDSLLLFASLRADSMGTDDRIKDVDYYSRIYKSHVTNDTVFSEPQQLTGNVNITAWDIANPAFDKKNQWLYFSKCDSNSNCEIWRSKFAEGNFQAAEILGNNINPMGSNNTQPYPVQINGNTFLFFASNRSGGHGQLDIWISEMQENGKFKEAINAGEQINSPDHEISPFYSNFEQKLYFSSTWHKGFGGFDIFYVKGIPGNFSKATNLGKHLNSSMNDFYFSYSDSNLFFVSDRYEGKSNCCCNNIYSSIFIPEKHRKMEQKQEKSDRPSIPTVVNVDVMNKYLPVELYFHNDYPNPNSWDTNTLSNYELLVEDYIVLKDEYLNGYSLNFEVEEKQAAKNRINSFFEDEVKAGFEKLEFFMPMLVKELEKGNKIQMTIKGYASNISGSEYNLNLTLRRIESLINYLKEYEGGVLLPYINEKAENAGQLSFVKLPFGDYVSKGSEELSGNMKIYSPLAAKNRKIEILAVTESSDGSKNMDGSSMDALPKINFNSTSYQLKLKSNSKVSPTFLVKNEGEATLKIYAVDVNCECAQIEFNEMIGPGQEGKITVNIDTKGMVGEKKIKLLVISNSVPNIQYLNIELLIEP